MKKLVRRNSDRIHKQDDWKKSAYAFVPHQTNFGELCGFADDVVAAGKGFGMHPHKNMEISTIVLRGSQKHKDNTGAEGTIDGHSVQTMSAGTGIMHSEYNASETEPFHSFQIWVYPKQLDVTPRHEQFNYKLEDKLNKILLALSPDKRLKSAKINQDTFFSLLTLEKGKKVTYKMHEPNNGVYIHTATGKTIVEDEPLADGDAIGMYDTNEIQISAEQDAELIFVEVPMTKGINV